MLLLKIAIYPKWAKESSTGQAVFLNKINENSLLQSLATSKVMAKKVTKKSFYYSCLVPNFGNSLSIVSHLVTRSCDANP